MLQAVEESRQRAADELDAVRRAAIGEALANGATVVSLERPVRGWASAVRQVAEVVRRGELNQVLDIKGRLVQFALESQFSEGVDGMTRQLAHYIAELLQLPNSKVDSQAL